jgi:hypothetical protein
VITYERAEFTRLPPEAERLEWCEWLHRHGINPSDVSVPGWIERRVPEYRVAYLAYALNERGERYPNPEKTGAVREERFVQLEGPPLPFPKALWTANLKMTLDMRGET